MRARLVWLAWPLVLGACAAGHGPGAERPSGVGTQQPVESACATGVRSLAELGLVLRSEFSGDAQAKITVTNAGSRPRTVSPRKLSLCQGACESRFSTCRDQRRFDAPERARYATTLAAGESIELLVDAGNARPVHACTKAGLVLLLDVDRSSACADAGTWILPGDPDQG
jgi:hypothetical protein